MKYGHFDDASRAFVITDPCTPKPWINYLGNGRLMAFVSQNAGGMMWYLEPESRRITRYQYTGSPSDRPGFYLYVKDKRTGAVWNPHFAPTCRKLDSYQCSHSPGITAFTGVKDGIEAQVEYFIPADDDVLVWKVALTNKTAQSVQLQVANYVEFGVMETKREPWWCYLQRQYHLNFDSAANCIKYDYHVFGAIYSPRMLVGCSEKASGYECSRDAFLGRAGSLENPEALVGPRGLSNSELPIGGHACGVLGVDVTLEPGQTRHMAYCMTLGDDWDAAYRLKDKYTHLPNVEAAAAGVRQAWEDRLGKFKLETPDPLVDRFVNTWNPYQSLVLLGMGGFTSTEHMGINGMRYRDHSQYALTPGNLDPDFAIARMDQVFASQKKDGMGCLSFFPYDPSRKPRYDVRRSDNSVWQIYTVKNLVEETGDLALLDRVIPFSDGGEGTWYDHTLLGLMHIWNNRGPQGLPLLFYADWNDCMEHWGGPETETVMLGMQLAYGLREFRQLALWKGRTADAEFCGKAADELNAIFNSDKVWDGQWYRRLLLADNKYVGGQTSHEGKLWINTQTWAVICGAGAYQGRGRIAMDSVKQYLDSPIGFFKQWPVIGTVPDANGHVTETGSPPGVGEYGGIFNHTQTWAIMAECMLGRNDQAFDIYRRCLPAHVAETFGEDHYLREPYAYVSSVVGPCNQLYGQGGISWITGTATWMYYAVTQYLLGIKPTLEGLMVTPHLPASMKHVKITRRFRGCEYEIEIDNQGLKCNKLTVDGKEISGDVIPVQKQGKCKVRCVC